jgi:MYXO-CTERM domain-containing protein
MAPGSDGCPTCDADGGVGLDAGETLDGGGAGAGLEEVEGQGCTCAVPAEPSAGGGLVVVGLAGLLVLRRRRR